MRKVEVFRIWILVSFVNAFYLRGLSNVITHSVIGGVL